MNFSGIKLNKYFETFEFFYLEFIFENLEKETRFPLRMAELELFQT